MNDEQNKMQLIKELEDLRQKVSELKESEDNRKRIEEKLRKSEKRLKLVGEIAYDVIYEWTVADDKLEWFGNIDEILGYKYNEVPRTIEGWLRLIHPEDVVCLEDAVEYHRISTKPIFNEYRVKHNDGTWRYWSDRGLPMVNEDGHPYKWMGVCTDFTERKKLEVDLRKVHQELEKKVEDRTANLKIANEQLQQEINVRKQAEEELRESEEKYHTLMETANDVIFIADAETGIITDANKKAEELVGIPVEEIIGLHQSQLHPKENEEYYRKIFMDHVQKRNDAIAEDIYICHRNGHKIPVEISTSVTEIGGKRVVQGIFRDITERKKAEKEIKEGKDFLESIIESSIDGIVTCDRNGYITSVNTAVKNMSSFDKDELIGKHISTLAVEDKDVRKKILKKIEELFEKGFTTYESQYKISEGTLIDVECSSSLIKDEKGDYIAGVTIIRDITERKKADREIRETKEFLEIIFKTSVDGIIVTDAQSYITMVNEAAEKMLGYSRDELIGKHTKELNPQGKKYEERRKDFASRIFKEGVVREFAHLWGRKDGSLVDVELNVALIKDDNGNIIGSVGGIRNITERKQAEKKLIEYQSRLKSLTSQMTLTEEHERRRFADYLHDQIGQRLFGLKLKMEEIRNSAYSSNIAECFDDSFKIITQLIKDTRSLTFDLSPPILYQLGLEAALEWLTEQTSEQYGIKVAFEDDDQEKELNDDIKVLLFQAVRELLTNIAKHAQAKNAKVSIQRDDAHIRVCVEDNGVGLTSSNRDVSKAANEEFGLFSIEERLDHLGGHFEIESKPGSGTRAIMVAPLKDEK
jgi:PAS domain S-box-containing protein